MSSELHRLKNDLKRVEGTSSVILQTGVLRTLMDSVTAFVDKIKEEEELVKQISQLQRQANGPATTPEEEKEKKEAHELLDQAKQLERDMSKKRALLRQLESQVENLLREIRKK